MRFVKSLFMMLALMVFITGFGNTTADLKQNSKTVFVKHDLVQAVAIEAVSVVEFQAVSFNETQLFKSSDVAHFILKNDFNPNQYAVIRDVGWNSWQSKLKESPYTENVLNSKDLYNYNKNKLILNRIRNQDQFTNSLPYIITARN